MNKVKDIQYLFNDALKNSMQTVRRLPLLLVIPIIYFLVYLAVFYVISFINLGIFSSLFRGLVLAAVLSSYFYVLYEAHYYKRFKFNYMISGIKVFLMKSWVFTLIVNLTFYIFLLLGIYAILGRFSYLLPLLLFALFNPMPEIIYLTDYNERDMFFYNFSFIKHNYLQWYLINGIFFAGLYLLFTISSYIPYVSNVLLLLYSSFVMIFRAYLFKNLHKTNYRKRIFYQFNK
ncbi:MAG: hypothetical protein JW702_03175 [Clostridiales bacterium]|nr:hypothetical protein [Clostridiales bacterium]